jgi:hypothetical protein
MTSEQSQEEQRIKSVFENEESQGNESPVIKGSQQQGNSRDTQSQDDESRYRDILPPEVLENLPPREKAHVIRSLSIMAMQGSAMQSSSLAGKLESEHITQIIENSEKDSQREFEKSKISENTKRWGMGAILSLVVVVFVYAGVTKDKDLSEKVVLAGISAIGGFGAGYAVAKKK